MFGSEKSKSARAPGGVETLIGARVKIRGDVHFSGGLYIEGSVQGAVIADDGAQESVVTVSENGIVHGEVRAPHIVVNGQLNGDVFASERIELGANAKVQGNIHYKVVEMAAGAMITGRLIHGDAAVQKQLPRPADKATPQLEAGKAAKPADATA
jgi:cytoskeletal protein CcmA (bactofilin family)